MQPSLLRLNSVVARKPLIQFLGKRKWPSQPSAPGPHPFAPAELKQSFSEFVAKFQSSGSSQVSAAPQSLQPPKKGSPAFSEYWQAPERLWKRELEQAEIDAVLSGGASLH
ncbi:hypothetical protein NLI96_g7089 [Meripilus lineatus]|uniref:Uncharacterized protein n=1 Tax=Meripilus lineatus TaxID=2056292 RepID=A0AAD5YCC7_9APHY|nr:hypothetical protein NLI96_g7089 [Physisporinus lineatus]